MDGNDFCYCLADSVSGKFFRVKFQNHLRYVDTPAGAWKTMHRGTAELKRRVMSREYKADLKVIQLS